MSEKAAVAYSLLGQNQEAYDWYLRAAERYPCCGRLHFHLGQLADRLGKPVQALQHYRETVSIEDAFRKQFRQMYPEREQVVSRLGEDKYLFAEQRIRELSE